MKSLAERFLIETHKTELQNDIQKFVHDWLLKQPENSKTFTIDEVEASARAAHNRALYFATPFSFFWEKRKQELMK